MVGRGDEVRRPLDRDLQLLDLAEIARQTAAGLAGGGDHHVHERGGGHGLGRSGLAAAGHICSGGDLGRGLAGPRARGLD